jgi:hypothetical protein
VSDDIAPSPIDIDEDVLGEKKIKKGQKPKKRPSDFEIVRTILQRTHERKLPILLRNMGEDEDLLVLCSEEEKGFTYGSSAMACMLVQFDNQDVKDLCHSVLAKLHGFNHPYQILINLRDQISALSKTKGERIDEPVETNEHGAAWVTRTDVRGQTRTVAYATMIDSLFHFEDIKAWCRIYRHLLTCEGDDVYIYPYTHPDSLTSSLITIPSPEDPNHPIAKLYPDGFRICVTRGVDVFITKSFEDHFPYKPLSQDLIFFIKDGVVAQMVHRIIGDGWRAILTRPNSVIFPIRKNITHSIEHGGL